MSAWTDERVETLKALWTQGLSTSQIAAQLGGITRNAVIGKVSRLGLAGRPKPAKPVAAGLSAPAVRTVRGQNAGLNFGTRKFGAKAKASKPLIVASNAVFEGPSREPRVVVSARAWQPLPGSTPRPWTERGHGCRWPVDVAGADIQHSCCEPKGDDTIYCPDHRRLATSATQPARTPKGRVNELIRANRRHAA